MQVTDHCSAVAFLEPATGHPVVAPPALVAVLRHSRGGLLLGVLSGHADDHLLILPPFLARLVVEALSVLPSVLPAFGLRVEVLLAVRPQVHP